MSGDVDEVFVLSRVACPRGHPPQGTPVPRSYDDFYGRVVRDGGYPVVGGLEL